MISLGSVRSAGKVIAQNTPETGSLGVDLLLNASDFDQAVRTALLEYDQERPNVRTVDCTVTTAGFRQVLKGTGALAALTGADAWPAGLSMPAALWFPWDATAQGLEPYDPNGYRVVRDPGGKWVLEFLADTPAVGDVIRLQFERKHALTEAPNTVTNPSAAPTAALTASTPGNVDNGAHAWLYTWITANGETEPSPTVSLTVTDKATEGQVEITIPASADYGVTGCKVYRTVAGGAGSKKLVGTLLTNGGVFVDTVADASLGAVAPSTNTAGGANTVDDDDEDLLAILVGSVILLMAATKAAQNTGNTNLPNDIVDRRSQSDIYRSCAKALRDSYQARIGLGASSGGPASAWGNLESTMSDGGRFLFHRG